jgi:predicted Zn-dependent protease
VQNRQFDIAIARLQRYTQILSDDPTGFYLFGEAYRKQSPEGNFQSRITAYENSIAVNGDFADPYSELGLACMEDTHRTGRQRRPLEAPYSAHSIVKPGLEGVPPLRCSQQ